MPNRIGRADNRLATLGLQAAARLEAEGLLARRDPARSLLRPGKRWPTPAIAARQP